MADNSTAAWKVPLGPVPPPPPGLMKAKVPWMSTVRKGNLPYEELVLRKVRTIMNKLTVEKYYILRTQLIDSGITTPSILQGVTSLIFSKAVMEPTFCPLYAFLCSELSVYFPSFPPDEPQGKQITFMRILLDICQATYESANMKAGETRQQTMTVAPNQDLEYGYKERRQNLGNIRFICELSKQRRAVLTIVSLILKHLVEQDDVEVNVEAICLLLSTVGRQLDESSSKSRVTNDVYFDRLKDLLTIHPQLATRLKFMIYDILDLRANNWVNPRHPNQVKDKAINELIRPLEVQKKLGRIRFAEGTTDWKKSIFTEISPR
ncbi:eukaryotic translation initiation factor-like [Papaver somniferum]|uniref:eukaryotic translation initiation factor-like n=1 Tax=Papaver somniferum TaxID=3469 RepID=UPI000E7002F7|nr:eukaryotic translation initiation factor-like [Papaver somniferum]